MKLIRAILLTLLLVPSSMNGQSFVSSNLPIVLIKTGINPITGQPNSIPDYLKIPASLKIINRPDGNRNFLADENNPDFLEYDGKIGIEVRGQSSSIEPKKPYGFETLKDNNSNNNVSLLGLPSENDWILQSFAFDNSLLRDAFVYELYRKMGHYASRGRYCEVFLNGNYQGIYMLMEKLKRDKNRIDVDELEPEDNQFPEISGGYITKSDKLSPDEEIAWQYNNYLGHEVDFLHHDPKEDEITSTQKNYIKSIFDKLESFSSSGQSSALNGFPSVIDMASFIDFMILNELGSNVDAYQYSTFFHKERGGKLRAGPVWDFNLSFGNDLFFWGFDRSHTNVWQFDNFDNVGANFWRNLFRNPVFSCYFSKRWRELTEIEGPLHIESLENTLDSLVTITNEARLRENQKWGNLGQYNSHIQEIKNWTSRRISWLTNSTKPLSSCQFPVVPNLVISKIHYHPKETEWYTENQLEFIEITNAGEIQENISGYYISQPGLGFVFPPNSKILAGEKIYLVSDAVSFEKKYFIKPFGVYERNLSNSSYHIMLRNAYGILIDDVKYNDVEPWPKQADGEGPYLVLKSLNLDNNNGENWMASDENLSSTAFYLDQKIVVSPNPFSDRVYFSIPGEDIFVMECYDVLGSYINTFASTSYLEAETLREGIYLVKLVTNSGKSFWVKVVKQ
ncbi:MAG: CotH kinase family protein [Saprospiraceae bacterium]|nr:CotH kinase family protein [Saprospiraceae bacterium]